MNSSKLFLAVVLFLLFPLVATAKKKNIHLDAMKKSPADLVEAFIDDVSKELILEFKNCVTDQNTLLVFITDLSGNRIYNKEVSASGFSVLPVPILNNGEYRLFIYWGETKLHGSFDVE